MPISNIIRNTLNIKDLNIIFSDHCLTETKINEVYTLVYSGVLSPDSPDCCPLCGTLNENYSIIKNGSKTSMVKLPSVSNKNTILKLKKQRYLCRHCNQTFSAQTDIIKPNHSISTNTYQAAILDTKQKISVKDIAKRYNISHTSLNNWLHNLHNHFIIRKDFLPENLSFDEFKFVNTIDAKMSFIFTDAVTGTVLDIVANRKLGHLRSYFHSYTCEARNKVKTICIDMYAPYIELIRSCFPNAEIITDRFHIMQLLNRSLNSTRIAVMNQNPKMRTRLKRYWKLFLKDQSKLDQNNYKSYHCFNYKMTEQQVLNELLRIDKELEETYWVYQNYLRNFRNKDIVKCQEMLKNPKPDISYQMKRSIRTLKKYEKYVANALTYEYSNGVIEGTNNLIKVIKRIAFGYRNYDNFRARILLITNTLVKLETT